MRTQASANNSGPQPIFCSLGAARDGVCQRLDVGFVHARILKHTPPPSNSDFPSHATANIHGVDEHLELILHS